MQQVYDRLARGFSARAAGAGSKSDRRRTGQNQLVTSVAPRDVNDKYEIERSQLGYGLCGVVRRCVDKKTREVRLPNT